MSKECKCSGWLKFIVTIPIIVIVAHLLSKKDKKEKDGKE